MLEKLCIWRYSREYPELARLGRRVGQVEGYLRRLVYKSTLISMSDNPFSAENQQERLIKIGWVTGFVDGEGCFSIGFVRQPDRTNRKGYKTGFQVAHRFVVTQGEKSLSCPHELRDFFGVGQVYLNKRFDNHKEPLNNARIVTLSPVEVRQFGSYHGSSLDRARDDITELTMTRRGVFQRFHKEDLHMYYVQRREDLLRVIIPFFHRYSMRSAKQKDFEKFALCVEWINRGYHLTYEGLIEIARVVQTMNRQKPRNALIRILRDHTPSIRNTG